MNSDLPTQRLLFFPSEDVSDRKRQVIDDFVNSIEDFRSWTICPPKFVDEASKIAEGTADQSILTVGGALQIFSATANGSLPRNLDEKNLDDVEALIHAVKRLSREQSLSFEFELDGVYVGAIGDFGSRVGSRPSSVLEEPSESIAVKADAVFAPV
jgi:hypothetical protein